MPSSPVEVPSNEPRTTSHFVHGKHRDKLGAVVQGMYDAEKNIIEVRVRRDMSGFTIEVVYAIMDLALQQGGVSSRIEDMLSAFRG